MKKLTTREIKIEVEELDFTTGKSYVHTIRRIVPCLVSDNGTISYKVPEMIFQKGKVLSVRSCNPTSANCEDDTLSKLISNCENQIDELTEILENLKSRKKNSKENEKQTWLDLSGRYVIVLNGKGGVGKNMLADTVKEKCKEFDIQFLHLSIVDSVKDAAALLGWSGLTKTDKDRKFLADLKDLTSSYSNYLIKRLVETVRYTDNLSISFVDIRDPKDIETFVRAVEQLAPDMKVSTLLVNNRFNSHKYGNHADDGVENYHYDHIFDNDFTDKGEKESLVSTKKKFINFFVQNILK